MNDRFTNGFIAGVVGGVAMSVINYISYQVGIVDLLYLDWAGVLISCLLFSLSAPFWFAPKS